MNKFSYRIRCRNGAVVENLQINGELELPAREKLMRMYPNCEVLNWKEIAKDGRYNINYEDVLDLISKY
jgi:hypothetical protein